MKSWHIIGKSEAIFHGADCRVTVWGGITPSIALCVLCIFHLVRFLFPFSIGSNDVLHLVRGHCT